MHIDALRRRVVDVFLRKPEQYEIILRSEVKSTHLRLQVLNQFRYFFYGFILNKKRGGDNFLISDESDALEGLRGL